MCGILVLGLEEALKIEYIHVASRAIVQSPSCRLSGIYMYIAILLLRAKFDDRTLMTCGLWLAEEEEPLRL